MLHFSWMDQQRGRLSSSHYCSEHPGHFICIFLAAAAAAKLLQSCPTLCDPIDGSPPGSSVPGSSRQEHWSGLPFPSPMHACMLSRFSHVWLCATPWTAAHQAPLSTGFSRQEYWSGLPFPSPVLPLGSGQCLLHFIERKETYRLLITHRVPSSMWVLSGILPYSYPVMIYWL